MILSANCGEMCRASIILPRQSHGLCQPNHHKPKRYASKFVVNTAIIILVTVLAFHERHTANKINSTIPIISIKWRNCRPVIGSGINKIFEPSNALHTFDIPVMKKTAPQLETSHFDTELYILSCAHSRTHLINNEWRAAFRPLHHSVAESQQFQQRPSAFVS